MFSDVFSSVESVKAASEAFCPASGKVLEVNTVGFVLFIVVVTFSL